MINQIKKHYFWVLPPFVTAVMLLLNMVQFTEVDDLHMQEMALSFNTNSHSEQLMFINVVFGYIIRLLFGLIPAINWFGVLYLFFANISFISALKVISNYNKSPISVCIITVMFVYTLRNLTFSGMAIITCLAGVIWAFEYIDKLSVKNIKHILYVLFLFLCGFGMRNGSVLYCVIGISVSLIIISLKNKKNSVAAIAVILVMAVASSYALIGVSRAYNASIPEETFFTEFNENRSAASDAGLFSYDDNKEYFEENGVSKNDLSLYSAFVFADKSVYNGKTVGAIANARGVKEKYETNPINIIKELLSFGTAYMNIFMYLFAALALALFILYKKKRLEIFLIGGFVLAEEAFLFFRRRGVPRIVNPIAIMGIILLVIAVSECENPLLNIKLKGKLKPERLMKAATAIFVAFTVAFCGMYAVYSNRKDAKSSVKPVIEYMDVNSENIYVTVPINYINVSDSHLRVLSSKIEYPNAVSIIGDWWVYSYFWYDKMEQKGLSEYTDKGINVLLKDDVYFVTRQDFVLPLLVEFYSEHYSLNVKYETVKEFDNGFKVVKFETAN